jgi:hypothetical protein
MIYIITYETSEGGIPNTTDILFTSTNKNMAKKVFDQYREFPYNDDYDYEEYFLYEYPEMDTINYPRREIETIIDMTSYDDE